MRITAASNQTVVKNSGAARWESQRIKKLIDEFERTAFDARKRIFLITSFQFVTLDNEVMAKRSKQNPVK